MANDFHDFPAWIASQSAPSTSMSGGPTQGMLSALKAGGNNLGPLGLLGGPLGSLAMSFAPGLIAGLFGNPAERERRKIMAMISPAAIEASKQRHLKDILGGQAFHQANRMAMIGGQAAQNSMSSNLAQRGLSNTGIGAVAPGLAGMATTNQRSNLFAGAGQMAQQQGHDEQYAMAGMHQQMMPQGGLARPLFAAGMNAFGPYMMDWMRRRQGGGSQSPVGNNYNVG